MRTLTLSAALVTGLATVSWAGPLNRSHVPAHVQWVAHVDVEAALASTLGRLAVNAAQAEHLADLEEVRTKLGIDPLKDIKGITVYCAGGDLRDGVAVIEATAAVDDMVKRMREKEKGIEEIIEGKLTLYRWREHGEERYGLVKRGTGEDERLVLVAADRSQLLAGVKLIDGTGETLAEAGEGLLATAPRSGSFLFAAATNLGSAAQAIPFQKADGFLLDVGEADDAFYAHAVILPKSTKDAQHLANAMRGAVAMALMYVQQEPEAAELAEVADHLEFGAKEGKVTIDFSYPSGKLVRLVTEAKAAREKSENKPARSKPARKNQDDGNDRDR